MRLLHQFIRHRPLIVSPICLSFAIATFLPRANATSYDRC